MKSCSSPKQELTTNDHTHRLQVHSAPNQWLSSLSMSHILSLSVLVLFRVSRDLNLKNIRKEIVSFLWQSQDTGFAWCITITGRKMYLSRFRCLPQDHKEDRRQDTCHTDCPRFVAISSLHRWNFKTHHFEWKNGKWTQSRSSTSFCKQKLATHWEKGIASWLIRQSRSQDTPFFTDASLSLSLCPKPSDFLLLFLMCAQGVQERKWLVGKWAASRVSNPRPTQQAKI